MLNDAGMQCNAIHCSGLSECTVQR